MSILRSITIILLASIILVHVGCAKTSTAAKGAIAGYVLTTAGNPISGAKVYTSDSSTITDTSGRWMLEYLKPDMLDVVASRENYQSQTKKIEVLSGEIVDNIDFVLPSNQDIQDIILSSITSNGAEITLNTLNRTKVQVFYGKDQLYNNYTPLSTGYSFSHTISLKSLLPATTYRFKVVAFDEYDLKMESEPQVFTTGSAVRSEPPQELEISKIKNSNLIKLVWSPNVAADFYGFNIYRSEAADTNFAKVGTSINNSFEDMNVLPGEKYYYRITRLSASGDESPPSKTEAFLMPGYVNSNVVWTAENSPYLLTGNITVAPGSSLLIDKGVSVALLSKNKWEDTEELIAIKVQGTLLVQGTESQPASLYSSSEYPQAGDWQGIIFEENSDLSSSIIKGIRISNAVNGILGKKGIPDIFNSVVSGCKSSAISSTEARRDINIEDNLIENCETGINLKKNYVYVTVKQNTLKKNIYSIVCTENLNAEISENVIAWSSQVGIDVGNHGNLSLVSKNIVGYGSTGVAVRCSGMDQLRRNTLQAHIGIEFNHSASLKARSNMILADNSRGAIGVLYNGSSAYSEEINQFQNNLIWNIPAGNTRRYMNNNSEHLPGIIADISFNPLIAGDNPFELGIDMTFSYRPVKGSPVRRAGYEGEDVGALDVSN